MAVLSKANVANLTAGGTGFGGTLLIRDRYDEVGDTSAFRPSVMFGLGLGLSSLGLSLAQDGGMVDVPMYLDRPLKSFGMTATTAGLFSAVAPKGETDLALPVSEQR